MKRYLRVISSIDPAHGGPVEGIKQISSLIREHGAETEVVCMDAPEEPFIKGFPLPVHALGPGRGVYGYTSRLVPWIRENARNYDGVIINGIWTFSSYGTYLGLRGTGVPYIVFTHGMLDPYFKQFRLKHFKKCLYWPWAEYQVLRHAASVCFTCEEERVLARQSFKPYQCNETVVNYGTAGPAQGKNDEERQLTTFFDAWPHLRNKRFFLFLSRIHPKKGCDLLMDAFGTISPRYPDMHLVMAGPDQVGWQRELTDKAQRRGFADRVTWTGMLSGDTKWGAYRAAEAFVLPSHQENFGIVVAEALACNTPVLITDKVNIWREIASEQAGFTEPDTEEGILKLLSRWLELSSDQRDELRDNARSCFLQRFEIRKAAESFINVLANTMGENKR